MVQDVIQLINVCPTSINTSPLALNNIWITVHNIQNWYLHPFLLTQCWMFAEKPQKINQGSSCDLFVNSFNNIKKRTNGKSTGGGCSSGGGGLGGGGPTSAASPRDQPSFLHIRRLLKKKLLWHKGRFPSNTDVLIEKCWCLPVHSLAASVIIWSTRCDSTIPIRSEECVGYGWLSNKTINNLCSWNKKQSWKANGETCPNLFNILVHKLRCVATVNTVGESTSSWLFHRQGASDGDFKPR